MQLKKLMEMEHFCLIRKSKETEMVEVVVAKFQLDFHCHRKEENIPVFIGKSHTCS